MIAHPSARNFGIQVTRQDTRSRLALGLQLVVVDGSTNKIDMSAAWRELQQQQRPHDYIIARQLARAPAIMIPIATMIAGWLADRFVDPRVEAPLRAQLLSVRPQEPNRAAPIERAARLRSAALTLWDIATRGCKRITIGARATT